MCVGIVCIQCLHEGLSPECVGVSFYHGQWWVKDVAILCVTFLRISALAFVLCHIYVEGADCGECRHLL